MKKLLLLIVCGLALLGCDGFMELQVGSVDSVADNIDYSDLLDDRGDYYVMGGDMILGKNSSFVQHLLENTSGARTFIKYNLETWHNSNVPFVLSGFTREEEQLILRAMAQIEAVCGVTFERRTNVTYSTYHIRKSATENNSVIGPNSIDDVPFCNLKDVDMQTITHEIMHGLGFKHTHQRWDREKYVHYERQNIQLRYRIIADKNMAVIPRSASNTFGLPYDYNSVMHYTTDQTEWTYPGLDMLTVLGGHKLGVDEKDPNEHFLSPGDRRALQAVYGLSKGDKKVFTGNFLHVGHARYREDLITITDSALIIQSGKAKGADLDIVTVYKSGDILINYKDNKTPGSWTLDLANDRFYQGNFTSPDSDGLVVVSDWGIGLLHMHANSDLRTIFSSSNGTPLGTWNYDSRYHEIISIQDFDGDNIDELLIKSDWGLGILKYDPNVKRFVEIVGAPFKHKYGGWYLSPNDEIIGYGDFDGDSSGQIDFIVRSDWGLGILTKNGRSLETLMIKPYKTWFNQWNFYKGQKIVCTGDFDGDDRDEILISSDWGLGILELGGSKSLSSIMCKPYNQLVDWLMPFGIGGYYESYENRYFDKDGLVVSYQTPIVSVLYAVDTSDFDGDGQDEILFGTGRISGTEYMKYGLDPIIEADHYFLEFKDGTIKGFRTTAFETYGHDSNGDRFLPTSDYDRDNIPDIGMVLSDGTVKIIEQNGSWLNVQHTYY